MGKRWTDKEDQFIVAYYDAMGAFIGPHDLGRSEASTKARAKKLKDTGAWDAWHIVSLRTLFARILSGNQPKSSHEFIQDELIEMDSLGWNIPAGWIIALAVEDE